MKSFYLTTTLPYVNAEPHIGFAMEIIQADIIARYKESQGYEVFFNTGTDEHGAKIYRKAVEEDLDPQAYVDQYAEKFESLKEKLNLDPNLHFIRTTAPAHLRAAQEMWRRAEERGDIYKKKYKGLYCVGDEAFIKESDLVNGRCPNHPNLELQELEEENYFFKLSHYKKALGEYLQRNSIIPDWRRGEAQNMLKEMGDFSVSREKSRLTWGVPVPGDETQVMYVWFEALTSYISTLGWPEDPQGNFKKFWEGGETLQLGGKDQVKFQSIIWQAMLLSAGIRNTDRIFYHGFINSGGQKMSKSLGNVINPDDLIKEFGVDALRYYLSRHVSTFDDSDVTRESVKEAYNGNLANGLGNLVSRIMKLAETNLAEPVGFDLKVYQNDHLEKFEIQKAMDVIWKDIGELDALIQEKKPWESKDKKVIGDLVLKLSQIAESLTPFMPETSKKILEAIKNNKLEKALFPRKD